MKVLIRLRFEYVFAQIGSFLPQRAFDIIVSRYNGDYRAKHGEHSVVVTVLSDSNKKYLSTDLLKEEPVKPGHLFPVIELLDYIFVKAGIEA